MGAGNTPPLVLPNATAIKVQQNANDQNPANLQTATNVDDDFCDATNRIVFVCTFAASVFFYIAEEPLSSSLPALRIIAGACAFGFVGSFLGLDLAYYKNLKLVKFFTIVGATGALYMIGLALVDICYPEHAIWIGAMVCIPFLFALEERLFGFGAHLLPHIKSAFAFSASFTPLIDRIKRAFTSLIDRTKRACGYNPSPFSPPV